MSKKPKKRSKKWFFRGFGVKKSHMEPRFFLTFFRKPLKTPVFGLFLTIFDPFFDHFWPFFPYFPEVPAKNSQKPEKMSKKSIFWHFFHFFWVFWGPRPPRTPPNPPGNPPGTSAIWARTKDRVDRWNKRLVKFDISYAELPNSGFFRLFRHFLSIPGNFFIKIYTSLIKIINMYQILIKLSK